MNRWARKRWIRALAALFVLIAILLVVGPFLVPVNPIEGLGPARAAAMDESQFLTIPFAGTDGIDLHFLRAGERPDGDAPTFVLLHGSMFNANTWIDVLDFFAERGQVIAYDQVPYGLSEKLVDGDWSGRTPYSADAAVDQLFALLDALEVDDVVLVGSSFGGTLAAKAALAAPERVQALILVDAAIYVQEEMPAWIVELPQVRRVGPLFARWLGQDDGFIRQTYQNPDRISGERMALTTNHTSVESWDFALWEYLRAWGAYPPNVADRVAEIQQPTLVLAGEGDSIVPIEQSRRLDAELPQSELIVLPDCGHVPQEECPAEFEDAVAAWLSEWK